MEATNVEAKYKQYIKLLDAELLMAKLMARRKVKYDNKDNE